MKWLCCENSLVFDYCYRFGIRKVTNRQIWRKIPQNFPRPNLTMHVLVRSHSLSPDLEDSPKKIKIINKVDTGFARGLFKVLKEAQLWTPNLIL